MEIHSHTIRVRYGECDSMGFVHHSVYALYYEEARTEIMRKMALSYKELEDNGILMPVRNMSCHFKKAAVYDDLLEITVRLAEISGIRCCFEYETRNQAGELLNTGSTELFFVQRETMRPMKLPEEISRYFTAF